MLSDMRTIKQTGRFSLNRSTISLTSITASVNSKKCTFPAKTFCYSTQTPTGRAKMPEAIRLKPDLFEAHYNRGWAYGVVGEYGLAIADFTKAIRIRPDDADAYYNRGCAHGVVGEYGLAIADFTEVIRIKPDDADAYYSRGVAHEKQGDHDRATVDYAKAHELGYSK